jgi:hypothetical protein
LARHKFAVIALAAIALCSTFWALLDVLGAASHNRIFGVASFENRFDEFRRTVRPHSVYGYLSDSAPTDPSARPEFYLTQYTLAPALVKSTVEEPSVIVNYHSSKPDYGLMRTNKLAPVRDFGNGVILGRRWP